MALGGRWLKGQHKQADRRRPRYVASLVDGGWELRDRDAGETQTASDADEMVAMVLRGGRLGGARRARTATATRGPATCAPRRSGEPCASPAGSTAAATTAG